MLDILIRFIFPAAGFVLLLACAYVKHEKTKHCFKVLAYASLMLLGVWMSAILTWIIGSVGVLINVHALQQLNQSPKK